MANLHEALKYLISTSKDTQCSFNGVSRKYFPKWEGWYIIDSGGTPSQEVLYTFYKDFFWDNIQGDLIETQCIANLLLTFATISGKRKMTSKLQRVLNTDITGILTLSNISQLNSSNPNEVFLRLLVEFVELYVSMNTPERIKPLLSVYYDHERVPNK